MLLANANHRFGMMEYWNDGIPIFPIFHFAIFPPDEVIKNLDLF
jgi:hypothetical protein